MAQEREYRKKSFGSFFEGLQGKDAPARKGEASASDEVVLPLLRVLGERTPRPVSDLYKLSGLSAVRFAEALGSSRKAGLVEVSGSAKDQVVALTELGTQLASTLE